MTKTNEELLQHISNLETIIDSLPFDVWMKDSVGNYVFVNRNICDQVGSNREAVIGKNDYDLYEKELADLYTAGDRAAMEDGNEGYSILRQKNAIYEEYKKILKDHTGNLAGTTGFSRDITLREQISAELARSEERFRTIFEEAPIGIGIFNIRTGAAAQINARFAEILGRTKKEVLEMNWPEYTHPEDIADNQRQIDLLINHKIENFSLDKRFIRPDGECVWASITVAPFHSRADLTDFHLCMIEDITARKKAEDAILYLSYYDQLTGLYNRRYYEEELKRINTSRHLPITLALADVNGLKLTNDAFGHALGDNLLKKIAQVFKDECRTGDVVARIGGDEFVFLLPKTDEAEAAKIIERVHGAIAEKQKDNIISSVSFGFATKHYVKEDIRKIFMRAEDQMYRNKLSESTSVQNDTINLITKTLYQKNRREKLHCERVGRLCELIGNALKMSPESVKELKMAGLLHDIGKIGVDESLLNKRGQLSAKEWQDMKRHPEIGYHILRSVSEFAPMAKYILHHHERIDGKGYPRQLKSEDIPIQSKIICIADAYDAMTSRRPYRDDLSLSEVVEEFKKNAGSQFDPDILKVFIDQIMKQRVWKRMD